MQSCCSSDLETDSNWISPGYDLIQSRSALHLPSHWISINSGCSADLKRTNLNTKAGLDQDRSSPCADQGRERPALAATHKDGVAPAQMLPRQLDPILLCAWKRACYSSPTLAEYEPSRNPWPRFAEARQSPQSEGESRVWTSPVLTGPLSRWSSSPRPGAAIRNGEQH